MCELFIGSEGDKWVSRTKSLRIDGVATSIRMENFFWAILSEIAARDHMTTNQFSPPFLTFCVPECLNSNPN